MHTSKALQRAQLAHVAVLKGLLTTEGDSALMTFLMRMALLMRLLMMQLALQKSQIECSHSSILLVTVKGRS